MERIVTALKIIVVALAAIPAVIALPIAAKAQATAAPDITGIWERYPDPFASDASVFMDLPVPDGGPDLKEPYAGAWKAQRAKRLAALKAGTPLVDSSTLCLPEGMPTIMGAIFPIEILQTPGQVTVLAEFLTQTRRIYLDKPMPPTEEIAPSYYGFSSGHWNGDTLVVITRGVRKEVEFFEIPHSEQMTITEHLRLVRPKLIENKVVIDDPAYLKKPYAFTIGYRRKDDYRIMEYICDAKKDVINPDGTVSMKVEGDKR